MRDILASSGRENANLDRNGGKDKVELPTYTSFEESIDTCSPIHEDEEVDSERTLEESIVKGTIVPSSS
jgi:hypothetical protein